MPAEFLYNLTKKSVGASSAQALCGVALKILEGATARRRIFALSPTKLCLIIRTFTLCGQVLTFLIITLKGGVYAPPFVIE